MDTSADWPRPLTPQQRLARSARFWSVVGPLVLAYQWQQLKQSFTASTPETEREAEWTALHEWGAGPRRPPLAEKRRRAKRSAVRSAADWRYNKQGSKTLLRHFRDFARAQDPSSSR